MFKTLESNPSIKSPAYEEEILPDKNLDRPEKGKYRSPEPEIPSKPSHSTEIPLGNPDVHTPEMPPSADIEENPPYTEVSQPDV